MPWQTACLQQAGEEDPSGVCCPHVPLTGSSQQAREVARASDRPVDGAQRVRGTRLIRETETGLLVVQSADIAQPRHLLPALPRPRPSLWVPPHPRAGLCPLLPPQVLPLGSLLAGLFLDAAPPGAAGSRGGPRVDLPLGSFFA